MRSAAFRVALACGAAALVLAGCKGSDAPVRRVLLVTLDTTRADRLGCYGHADAVTPVLDELARESVRFDNAVSPIATTLPSHSSIFTGLYPQDHGVRYNLTFRLSDDATTLAERMKSGGFATAGFPASFIVSRQYGVAQGFDTWVEPPLQQPGQGADPEAIQGRRAGDVVDDVLEWIDGQAPDARWFVWAHFYDAHAPYSPPFPYSDTFRDRPYDGEIAYVDKQLGRLLARLRQDPAWADTLVIVAADHGEGLYDHGERFHGNLVYETTQHVPLLIRAPGRPPGAVEEPVTLVDLSPTVLDLAGLPAASEVRGISLRPALDGGSLPRRDIYFESLAGSLNYGWAELKGVRYGRWKLIDSASRPELFDLESDGTELENLASLDASRLQELREALEPLAHSISETSLADAAHDDAGLDLETQKMLAQLGYVGGGAGGSAADAPHPHELIDLEGELLAAQGAIAYKQWERLEEVCRYVLKRDPTNKFGLNNMVLALIETGRPAEAEQYAADAIATYPDAEVGYLMLTRALQPQGKIAEAQQVLERGLAVIPDSEAMLYFSVVAAFELGEPGVCERRLPEAMSRRPQSGRLHVLQARCRVQDGDLDGALEELRTSFTFDFRQFESLAATPEFAPLRDRPEFEELVERVRSERDAARAAKEDG